MDPLNSSEAQRQPLNCKSTASNTNPAFCGCCGLKDYAQAFPQPYFFRALYPALPPDKLENHGNFVRFFPECKYSQDNCEEKLPIQPQFFSSFPLYPHFFHNSVIPSNSCCLHYPQCHIPASEKLEKRHSTNENDQAQYYNHSEKERNGFMFQNTNSNEESQTKNGFIQPELQYIGNPIYFPNSPDPSMNFLPHRCACGDSFPWACTPFFLPVITYSVSWNSQKSSMNNGVFRCASAEPKQNNTESAQRYSNMSRNNEVSSTSLNGMQGYRGFPEGENCLSTETQYKKEGQNIERQRSSNSFVQESSNMVENSQTNCKENLMNSCSAPGNDSSSVCMEEEDMGEDEDEFASTGQGRDEKDNSNMSTFSNCSDDPSVKENESQLPSGSEFYWDLKKDKTEDGGVLYSEKDTATKLEAEISTKETNLIEEWKETTLKIEPSNATESKKYINNFTLPDQVECELYERAQVSAAAGDLGGVNCTGYKINIQEIEDYTIPQEIIQEENTHYDVYSRADSRENEPPVTPEKVTDKINKRNSKSGIAKLKESRGNASRNVKEDEKESIVMKRKHSCFPFENTVRPKMQKTKNGKAVEQYQGLTQQKTTNIRNDLPKKEGPPKPQLTCNSPKIVKCLVKKTKN